MERPDFDEAVTLESSAAIDPAWSGLLAPSGRATDVFGIQLAEYLEGRDSPTITEREDGYIKVGWSEVRYWFSDFANWYEPERRAMEHVRGRVLDIGCGAGRHALHLQALGGDVLAVDSSPVALQVAERRGVRNLKCACFQQLAAADIGRFDSVLLLGHNLGLLENATAARQRLRLLYDLTTPDGVIIGGSRDVTTNANADSRNYHAANIRRGRMPGQTRMRFRFKACIGSWFDYLYLARKEVHDLLMGTGWAVDDVIGLPAEPSYVAVMRKR